MPGDLRGVEGWRLPRGLHSLDVLRLRGGRDGGTKSALGRSGGRRDAGRGCPGRSRGRSPGVRERGVDAYLVTWPQVSSCPRGSAPRSTRGCAGALRRPGRPPSRAWASRYCARCWSPGPTAPPGSRARLERPWWARGARAPAAAAALPAPPPPLAHRARLAPRAAALARAPAAADAAANAAATEPPAHPSPGRRLRRPPPLVRAPVPGQWLRRPPPATPARNECAAPPAPPSAGPLRPLSARRPCSRALIGRAGPRGAAAGGRPAPGSRTYSRAHSPRTRYHFPALTRLNLVPHTCFHSSSVTDTRKSKHSTLLNALEVHTQCPFY